MSRVLVQDAEQVVECSRHSCAYGMIFLAALCQGAYAEDIVDCTRNRLHAIEDVQRLHSDIDPVLDEIGLQREHQRGLYSDALPDFQGLLLALSAKVQGHQYHAIAELDAVDHHRRRLDFDGPQTPLEQPLSPQSFNVFRDIIRENNGG